MAKMSGKEFSEKRKVVINRLKSKEITSKEAIIELKRIEAEYKRRKR